MKGIPVTRAELYDAKVQYVVGDYWAIRDAEEGDSWRPSRRRAITCCKSIELTYPVEGIRLKVVFEDNKELDIMYRGGFFITHEDNGNDQTRR